MFLHYWYALTEARIERMVESELPLNRVVALFGLYTFYMTQPCTESPSLHSNEHIDMSIGMRLRLYMLL